LPELKVEPAQLIHMDPGLPKTPMKPRLWNSRT
jgi:hypothetical protein